MLSLRFAFYGSTLALLMLPVRISAQEVGHAEAAQALRELQTGLAGWNRSALFHLANASEQDGPHGKKEPDSASGSAPSPSPPPQPSVPSQSQPSYSTADAKWDIFDNDPKADFVDGQPHPKEKAIFDRKADPEDKARAWEARQERLIGAGGANIFLADKAEHHRRVWACRANSRDYCGEP